MRNPSPVVQELFELASSVTPFLIDVLVHVGCSLSEWQAVKLTFFAPCKYFLCFTPHISLMQITNYEKRKKHNAKVPRFPNQSSCLQMFHHLKSPFLDH